MYCAVADRDDRDGTRLWRESIQNHAPSCCAAAAVKTQETGLAITSFPLQLWRQTNPGKPFAKLSLPLYLRGNPQA